MARVRRTGCVPMWWHRSITFPIDKGNNKEGCNAVRLVNAFSPDSKAFCSYLWRRQRQMQQRACASGCTAHRSRLEFIAQSVNVAESALLLPITMLPTPILLPHMHLSRRPWWTHYRKTRDSQDNATNLPRWKSRAQTRASLSDQGPAKPRAAAADAFHSVYHKRIDKMVRSPASRIVARGAHFQTTSCGPRSVQFACFLWDSQPTQTMCVSLRSPRSGSTHCYE